MASGVSSNDDHCGIGKREVPAEADNCTIVWPYALPDIRTYPPTVRLTHVRSHGHTHSSSDGHTHIQPYAGTDPSTHPCPHDVPDEEDV